MRGALVWAALFALTAGTWWNSRNPVPLRPMQATVDHQEARRPAQRSDQQQRSPDNLVVQIKPENKSVQSQEKTTNQKQKAGNKNLNSSPDPWVIISALAASAAILVYGYQAFLMRQTLIHANRAYIHANRANANFFRAHDGRCYLRISVNWDNAGNTPTRQMTNYTSFQPMVGDIPPGFDFPDIEASPVAKPAKLLIGPKQSAMSFYNDIAPESILAARLGSVRIFWWGWAEYKDVFRLTPLHKTEFCYEVVIEGGFYPEDMLVRFDFVWAHNAANQDCYRKPGERAPKMRSAPVRLAIPVPADPPDILGRWGLKPPDVRQPPPS